MSRVELEEREVDFGRWVSAVAARWWLPVVGFVVGIALGWALSVGGEDVYRAQALVSMGDPLAPSGARVTTIGTSVSQRPRDRAPRRRRCDVPRRSRD